MPYLNGTVEYLGGGDKFLEQKYHVLSRYGVAVSALSNFRITFAKNLVEDI